LSRADGDFDNGWRFYKHDSALGDLIADAFLDAGKSENVQIAMENRGGIRARIDKGPINLEKIEEILPFDNHLATADVTGKTLRNNLEHSVSGSLGGRFLDISGAKFAYDFSRPPGDRIIFILTKDKSGNWQKLTDDGVYRIGMTDYSFKGGEGYDFKDAKEVRYSADKLNVPLKQFFIDHPVVTPQMPNRICCVDGSLTGYLNGSLSSSKDGFRKGNRRISLIRPILSA
jgi:5''-nucleotidase/2'',3''-cyclic phosphodiesterase and related esterases